MCRDSLYRTNLARGRQFHFYPLVPPAGKGGMRFYPAPDRTSIPLSDRSVAVEPSFIMATKDLKVIVAGGGVAGLTLANMLEQFGIDYLVLEAHSHIAPPVGASIGLFPNGLRILDEMGCYDEIRRMEELRTRGPTNTRDESGKVIKTLVDMPGTLEIRYDRLWPCLCGICGVATC